MAGRTKKIIKGALSPITSAFGALTPNTPKPEPEQVMPTADDEELMKARRRMQQATVSRRRGRASTILSDGLG